ncbi:MAG: fibronectin type III domain-containing protein [Ruminococcus sp.]|nr:fibronectin type III domain-containing protein [Ruminococcus sp.]
MAENYEAYGYHSPNDVPAVGALSKAYTTPWLNHVNYGQTYSSIEVNKFNDKVRDYYDVGGSQEKLGKIDMSKYNSAVIGDAYSYPADKEHIHNYATQQEYSDLDGNKKETEMIFVSKYPVTVNSNADSDAEIEIEFEQTITSGSSTGYDIGGTAGLTGEIDFLVGQIDGSAGYSGEREENTVYSDSTITGKSFGVQVCNWEDYTQDGDNNGVPGNKYDFNVAPVVLKSLPLSNGDTPFMLTYAVTPLNQGHIAPAIPDNIHVNTVSASALNVTWKNVSTPDRPVSQYEILQRNVSAKEDNFVSVGTVDATASSFLATNLNPETTYAYKVRSIYDGTYSVCSSEAQGTNLPLEDSGPSFIKHPANAFVKEADVSNGTTVTFDASAVPASKDHAISYQWQKLEDSGTEGSVSQWVNLSDNTASNPTAFSGTKTDTLSVALNSGNAEELNGAIFRVIAVEECLGTARSQAVSRSAQLIISENEPIKTSTDLKMTNAKDATATVTDANGDPVHQGKVSFFLYKRNGEGTIAADEQATATVKATPHNSRRTACLNLIPSACPKNLGKATALPQFICAT